MTTARETADALESRGTAATVDTGLLTGNVPTADDLSMVGETVNWTGGNFDPLAEYGLGTRAYMYTVSGSIAVGQSIAASGIYTAIFNTAGNVFPSLTIPAGQTWKNVDTVTATATIPRLFVRIL